MSFLLATRVHVLSFLVRRRSLYVRHYWMQNKPVLTDLHKLVPFPKDTTRQAQQANSTRIHDIL